MSDPGYMVPGRSCGGCSACCTELGVVGGDLRKMPGDECPNCVPGKGCAIYAQRPQPCRNFHCLWLSLDGLDDSWRPDRSRIMFMFDDVPDGWSGEHAVSVVLLGDASLVEQERAIGVIAGFIESGTATYLNLAAHKGMYSAQMLLNHLLGPAIKARNLAMVRAQLKQACVDLAATPTRPVDLDEAR